MIALDSSAARSSGRGPTRRSTGWSNIEWREADAFEALRTMARARERFDTIVLDPPAFAKTRASVPDAIRGYREINLRAMRCLAPGGTLLTASCSFHVRLPEFLAHAGARPRATAAAASALRRILGARARTIPRS